MPKAKERVEFSLIYIAYPLLLAILIGFNTCLRSRFDSSVSAKRENHNIPYSFV